jgi:cytochrome P450
VNGTANARYTALAADGPLPWDMIRAVPQIRRDVLGFLEATVRRYGDIVAFPLPGPGVLLVNDPQGARRVLQDNHRAYGKKTIQYTSLSLVTGSGLLTCDGPTWRAHRRVVQPAFHHGRLEVIAGWSATASEHLRQAWDSAGPEVAVDADAACMRAMLEVVGHILFAADLSQAGERVVHAVDEALRQVVAQAQSPVPSWVATPGRRRLARAVATLDAVCYDVVARRRSAGLDEDDADLLALLLRAASGPDQLSDAEVRDELVTLVIAGHETVASSLTWTLYLLAEHRDVQARLFAELDAVLAGRRPTWDDLPELPYTRAVIEESLRLYPPAWVITRRALGADEICGVEVGEGTLVILSPWLLHRRAASWPEPLEFRPARFGDGGAAQWGRGSTRGDYVPFGAGPRLCIGRDLALVQASLVLAGLLRDREVAPAPGNRAVRVDALVTLRPRGGLPLVLRSRRVGGA